MEGKKDLWRKEGSFIKQMAAIERKAPLLTLECLAYRAAKWKYNFVLPNHISEPLAYPRNYKPKPIEAAYDEAREMGYEGGRFFVKHGLWQDLHDYNYKLHNGARKYFREEEIPCFVCYLKLTKYPYIERDPPHDLKVSTLCEKDIGVNCHFVHHFKGYNDRLDYRLFANGAPLLKYDDFIPGNLKRFKFTGKPIALYIP